MAHMNCVGSTAGWNVAGVEGSKTEGLKMLDGPATGMEGSAGVEVGKEKGVASGSMVDRLE
jgi:hypothetical protein